jgi:hypothetical protein
MQNFFIVFTLLIANSSLPSKGERAGSIKKMRTKPMEIKMVQLDKKEEI